MKSELKKRLTASLKEHDAIRDMAAIAQETFTKVFSKDVIRQVKLALANDGELTRFRNLYSKFSMFNGTDEDHPKMSNNLEMYSSTCMTVILNSVLTTRPSTKSEEITAEFLLGRAEVGVELIIPDRPEDHDHSYNKDYLGYTQPIGVSTEIIELYFTYRELEDKRMALNQEYITLELKLKDIDAVAEEMEAQLLVNELSKTDEGRAALEIAGNLVGDMLGDKPALLDLQKT